ncbi:MAG: oligosaccharide flippase family protein [Stellaceae bacterium]
METLELGRGLVTAVLVLLLAIPAAAILHEPRLIGIAGFIAGIAAFLGFANVGVVEFRSDLAFARECIYTLATKLASFVVAVPLAFVWRDYRALVASLVTSAIARVVLSFVLHPYRPRLSLARFREVFGFSKWLWLSSQLFFVRTRSDELFVGKFAGIAALGFYRIARTVAELPTTELITPVLAAIFPGFSKLSGEGKNLAEGYLAVLAGGLCLMAPLAFGLLVTADLVIDLGFGRQWAAAAPLLRLLAFAGPLELLVGNAYAVFVAMGRPRLFTLTSLVNAAAFLLLLALLVPAQGGIGAATAGRRQPGRRRHQSRSGAAAGRPADRHGRRGVVAAVHRRRFDGGVPWRLPPGGRVSAGCRRRSAHVIRLRRAGRRDLCDGAVHAVGDRRLCQRRRGDDCGVRRRATAAAVADVGKTVGGAARGQVGRLRSRF